MLITVLLPWIFGLCSLVGTTSTTVIDTTGRGLQKNDIIEWNAVTNVKRIPSFLYIRAPMAGLMYPLLKLQLQGARNNIIVQSSRQRPADLTIMHCRVGADVIAPGKRFQMFIYVRSEDFQIYIDGYLKYTLKIAEDAPPISEVTKVATYNSDGELRILDEAAFSTILSEPNCGINTLTLSPPTFCTATGPISERIVGGVNAKPGSQPWQVAIRKKPIYATAQPHVCGGTLISNCLVVTAGHCFFSLRNSSIHKLVVRVGDYFNRDGLPQSQDRNVENSEDIEIERVIRHEKFVAYPSPENDVALIKLKTCINFDKFKRPACLPTGRNQFRPGSRCGISGWGALNSTHYPTEYPACLQSAEVEIKTDRLCTQQLGDKYLLKKMMCANTETADTCQGDSGGPMMCNNNDNRYFLWGITSWGEGCGLVKKPGVYTRVSTYLRWLFVAAKLSPPLPRYQNDIKKKLKPKYCQNYLPSDL